MVGGLAANTASPEAWRWAGLYVFLAVFIPLLFVIQLVQRGEITDVDVQLREERMRPFAFTITAAGSACLLLTVGRAPLPLLVLAGTSWLLTVLLLSFTLCWKISVHVAVAAEAAILIWGMSGSPLPLFIVPVIAWSRVRLGRHTSAQVIAGALLGASIALVALYLMR
jgi:membrane-associated phospholipid phosphatase